MEGVAGGGLQYCDSSASIDPTANLRLPLQVSHATCGAVYLTATGAVGAADCASLELRGSSGDLTATLSRAGGVSTLVPLYIAGNALLACQPSVYSSR